MTTKHSEPDDLAVRRLIEALQAGRDREESFRRIFVRYYPPLRVFFAKRGVPPEECNDLIQETFINVAQGVERFQHGARFDTWLYKIAGNAWKNALRGRSTQKRDAPLVPLEADLDTADGEPDPEQKTLVQERARLELEALRQELEKLPPQMRRCLLLRLDQGLKYREIAEVLDVAINTVKSLLHEAKRRLKENLGERLPDRAGRRA